MESENDLKQLGDELSEDILGEYSDEYLLEQLHNCCNANCLVINEVIRRYNNKKNECNRVKIYLEGLREKFPRLTDWEFLFRYFSKD